MMPNAYNKTPDDFIESLENSFFELDVPNFNELQQIFGDLKSLNEYVKCHSITELRPHLERIDSYKRKVSDFIVSYIVGRDLDTFDEKKKKSVRLALDDLLHKILY